MNYYDNNLACCNNEITNVTTEPFLDTKKNQFRIYLAKNVRWQC